MHTRKDRRTVAVSLMLNPGGCVSGIAFARPVMAAREATVSTAAVDFFIETSYSQVKVHQLSELSPSNSLLSAGYQRVYALGATSGNYEVHADVAVDAPLLAWFDTGTLHAESSLLLDLQN